MYQPEQEESQHAGASDAHGCWYVVRNACIAAPEDCSKHVCDECGAGVQLHPIPNDGEGSTSQDEVVGSVEQSANVSREWS